MLHKLQIDTTRNFFFHRVSDDETGLSDVSHWFFEFDFHFCGFFFVFVFADDLRLCYSIREQICVGVWPKPKGFASMGFATNLQIKSRCIDAGK